MAEIVSFAQIVTAVAEGRDVLYGLTTAGAVYQYSFAEAVWVPLSMRATRLAQSPADASITGSRLEEL